MKRLILCLLFVTAAPSVAFATDEPAVALQDAGSASAPAASAPADKLHDPLTSPAATIDDAKQAKRQGWTVLAFLVGCVVARTLGKLGAKKGIAWLAWLNRGRTAVIVGAFGAFATAGYNAVADGGSPYAGLYAGALAAAAWWQSHSGEA